MKKIAGLIVLAYSCSHPAPVWYGVDPDHAQCGEFGDDNVALCIAGGRQYTCIAEDTSGCHAPRGSVQCAPSNHEEAQRILEEHRREQKKNDDDVIILNSAIPASN